MTRLSAATLLGQNVQRLCQRQGTSLDALAVRLGWTSKTVADLASSSLDITLDQLDALCAALDVTPHDLFAEITMTEDQAEQRRFG